MDIVLTSLLWGLAFVGALAIIVAVVFYVAHPELRLQRKLNRAVSHLTQTLIAGGFAPMAARREASRLARRNLQIHSPLSASPPTPPTRTHQGHSAQTKWGFGAASTTHATRRGAPVAQNESAYPPSPS